MDTEPTINTQPTTQSLTPEQKRARDLQRYKRYYQKTCIIRNDMTDSERQACDERLKKRRETSTKYRHATKELIANLQSQIAAQQNS